MTPLQLAAVLVVGFVGSAEFGSAAFVHPVIRRLAPDDQLVFEKGLLRTFGRVMPVGMTAAAALGVAAAIATPTPLLVTAATSLAVALVVTIVGNVPINLRTGRMTETTASDSFIRMRRRWDVFQVARASLQLLGFVLLALGLTAWT
ncbi:DUF1772 domain-containing protein [Pseudoclavibacter chungangensis]|uniref:DUF1772 domain-containing protein n=1 Tax=Pseudoclavibacter chungangensis TaxID=587635 RepID=A0A7J5BRI2_9MICO|nr:DUF1772 domain-containing protein [Pseudoclavibacter chungangensis]KAB1656855.1 DUF1772 domain-containing protein [Pseudoclavibacter chungangensis]NYJ67319.1 hypothetical protein [Pseudoclavibacter chungangensis]